MGALVHGLTAVVEPIFSASSLVERWIETGASVFSGVGAMGMAVLATPASDRDRETRLRVALMIPFPPDQQKVFEQRFGAGWPCVCGVALRMSGRLCQARNGHRKTGRAGLEARSSPWF